MKDQEKSRVAMFAATKEEPAMRNGGISTKTAAHFQVNWDLTVILRLSPIWHSQKEACVNNKLHYMLCGRSFTVHLILNNITFTGIVHPQNKVRPLFTHRHVSFSLYAVIFSVEHTSWDYFNDVFRYFLLFIGVWQECSHLHSSKL